MAIQTTYTHARAKLASLLDEVTKNREIVIIQRRGSEDVAMITADELAGVLETAHLLRSPPEMQSDSTPRSIESGKDLVPLKPLMTFETRSALSKKGKKASGTKKQRESVFQPEFRDDLRYWVETDRKTALRVFQLIEGIMRDPFQGIGKPEPLKFLGSGVLVPSNNAGTSAGLCCRA